jgi:O-antigen/teichoic acid export membrane protein
MAMRHLRVLGRPRFDVPHLHTLFRSGSAIVLGNISGTSLSSAGIAVLGAMADPVVTGAANMALRIRTAALAVLVPLGQLGFVRLSSLVGVSSAAAIGFGRRLFYLMMGCSVVLAVLIGTNADRIAALVYGLPQAPEIAAILVRLLALGLPACTAAGLFGLQGLTLFRQERAYVLVSVTATLIFFGLLLALHHITSANFGWAMFAADLWTAVAAGLYLRHSVKSHAAA